MKIRKKVISILTGTALLAVCLTGCKKTDKALKESEALTLTLFNHLVTEDFFEPFHEKYPEVTFNIQRYDGKNGSGYALYSLLNGDIPDIYITTQNFDKEAQQKYLLDLSNYDFVNEYSNTLLDSMDVHGGIYLLPSGYNLMGIYYNKTILEENGWEVPKSFEELTALSENIETAGYRTMGHGMSLDGFPFNYFFNLGNTVYFGTPEGTQWKEEFPKGQAKAVGNNGLKKAAEYFKKWVDAGFITAEHTSTNQFYEGECVFFLCLGLDRYQHTAKDGKIYEFGTIPWLSDDGSNNMLTRSVTRYMGINKSLAEEGNEQKLENALKFLGYISTAEGQQALMSKGSYYMPSLNESSLPEDSPYHEIEDMVRKGRTVPLLYVGWESLIIPIAQDIKQFIEGKIDIDEMIVAFDETNDNIRNGSSEDIYAVAEETLTIEETARLVAIAEGIAAEADCAMISLNEYHGDKKCNNKGLGWYLYQGNIDQDKLNLIRPASEFISVVKMTGAEIKFMRDQGFDLDKDGHPYPYLLFTKGNMELEDDVIYTLAISSDELLDDFRSGAEETKLSLLTAVKQYIRELGTVSADVLEWPEDR